MKQILLDAKPTTDQTSTARLDHIDEAVLADLRDRCRHAVAGGLTVNASGANRVARALARRLRDRQADYEAHWTNLAISFDNNRSETDLRMVKALQEISGGWRTMHGADRFARINEYPLSLGQHQCLASKLKPIDARCVPFGVRTLAQ
ncbi:hypothetical protein ACIBF5_31970 [Micromonospora sp. NPDC050417]|uniref:hypothetical protein n=1 Tax=Micromonospora sp. NPDC050417 TaxID=3364280 RepID=UPI0037914F7D